MSQLAPLRILISETHNPWFNLATEEWIFREMDPRCQTLFLWRNAETVVIGRNQNPWSECNLAAMEADGIRLARRTTGGGAVFHDLGNTNFTFLSPKEGYSRARNLEIVVRALEKFGIEARASGRNDLVIGSDVDPRKVSGSAFRETRDRSFHHGTLLIHADLSRLANYLTPHPKKLESKGRASVRARVMNVAELSNSIRHDSFVSAMIESFCAEYGSSAEPEILDPTHLEARPLLKETFDKFSSWDWRFGHAPQFHHQMTEYLSWGLIEVHADVEKGYVEKARVFSDALFPDLIADLELALVGKSYDSRGVEGVVGELKARHPERGPELDELQAWLKTQVEI